MLLEYLEIAGIENKRCTYRGQNFQSSPPAAQCTDIAYIRSSFPNSNVLQTTFNNFGRKTICTVACKIIYHICINLWRTAWYCDEHFVHGITIKLVFYSYPACCFPFACLIVILRVILQFIAVCNGLSKMSLFSSSGEVIPFAVKQTVSLPSKHFMEEGDVQRRGFCSYLISGAITGGSPSPDG